MKFYILDGNEIVMTEDILEWGKALEGDDRRVNNTVLWKGWAWQVRVSTVFLGIDHAFTGPPMLFETMVFGGVLDQEMDRYSTWQQAEKGHELMVQRVRASKRWHLIWNLIFGEGNER